MEDFSKEYLEMCDKATKLQRYWEPQTWDYHIEKGNYENVYRVGKNLTEQKKAELKEKFSWIPDEHEIYMRFVQGKQRFREEGYRLFQDEIDKGTIPLKDSHKRDMKIRELVYFVRRVWDDDEKEWIKK